VNKKRNILTIISLIVLVTLIFILYPFESDKSKTIVVVMPKSNTLSDIDTNYYKLWLEEQTGLTLEFKLIPEGNTNISLKEMIKSDNLKADIYFELNRDSTPFFTRERLLELGEAGYFLSINEYLDKDTNLVHIIEDFNSYNLLDYMQSSNGELYYMPNLDHSFNTKIGQALWLNYNWLKELKLSMPQTTDELYEVLTAFKTKDPNGNGLADEIPLAGSNECWNQQSYNFIINAFVHNNPEAMRMFVENDIVKFAPITEQWRESLQYLNLLYKEELLHPFQFSMDNTALSELANSPQDILGGFTASNVTDVLYFSCLEVIDRFYNTVPPLIGSDGNAFVVESTSYPTVGAVISSQCDYPDKAFLLLDTMLSEEAFLISLYGEEGLDWEMAVGNEMAAYGGNAILHVNNQLEGQSQNKHFNGLGPLYVYPQYANQIIWEGFAPDNLNARVYHAYKEYIPNENLSSLLQFSYINNSELQKTQLEIENYINDSLHSFITGELDPYDDITWEGYLVQLQNLDLATFIHCIQKNYDSNSWRE